MPKLRTHDDDSALSRLKVQIAMATMLAFAAAAVLTWHFLPPPLPKVVRLGTGPVGGDYARFAEGLREEVAKRGIQLELIATAGSMENLRLLLAGELDVGLVQSGNLAPAEVDRLESVAAVFYEPMLLVVRSEWAAEHGRDVEGGRIAIGKPGSGANALARELLADQGVSNGAPPGTELVELGDKRALDALLSGEVDSGIFVTSLDVDWVHTLFSHEGLRVADFALAEAFTRHYRYLRRLVIPTGLIDLRAEIPSADIDVIATTASLVIRPETHHAIIPLLIESVRDQLSQGSLLAAPDQFPSAYGVEAPLAEDAQQYFDRGPSFLYRVLPFRYAFASTRLVFLLLPLVTLMYPLYRSLGLAYRWLVQRRVYRWYGVLRRLERKMDAAKGANFDPIRVQLEQVGAEIRVTRIPARYASSLFALRAHHLQLVSRLEGLEKAASGS
jgi:TRAP transporter TAXI family solute receptor